ncbi:hypothetical protein AMATHDRAFT_111401, partial [Amanita thiersii Skay4041]
PPMGLTFLDIQNLSREGTALYPPRRVPVYTQPTEDEKRIAQLQVGISTRLRSSPYFVVEKTKSIGKLCLSLTELPRYSDKYRPSVAQQPTLKRSDLHAPFFPTDIFEDYFNPKRKKKSQRQSQKSRAILDDMVNTDEEKSEEERQSNVSSEGQQSDYDVEEEYDNDYAANYFDNGEGDDLDNLGDGVGGDDGGGG